jgi:hypothetical protein
MNGDWHLDIYRGPLYFGRNDGVSRDAATPFVQTYDRCTMTGAGGDRRMALRRIAAIVGWEGKGA